MFLLNFTFCFPERNMADSEPFDDDLDLDQSAWINRIKTAHMQDGFRSGQDGGQEVTLQRGFDCGYEMAFQMSYRSSYLRGLLTSVLGRHLTLKYLKPKSDPTNSTPSELPNELVTRLEACIVKLTEFDANFKAHPWKEILAQSAAKEAKSSDVIMNGDVPLESMAETCLNEVRVRVTGAFESFTTRLDEIEGEVTSLCEQAYCSPDLCQAARVHTEPTTPI